MVMLEEASLLSGALFSLHFLYAACMHYAIHYSTNAKAIKVLGNLRMAALSF